MNELSEDMVKIQAASTSAKALFLVYATEPAQSNTHVIPMEIHDADEVSVTYAVVTQPLRFDEFGGVAIAPRSAVPPQNSGQGPSGWSLGEWRIATFGSFGEALAFYAGNTSYPIGGGSFVQLSTQQRDTASLISTLASNPEVGAPRAYVVLYQEMSVHVVLP